MPPKQSPADERTREGEVEVPEVELLVGHVAAARRHGVVVHAHVGLRVSMPSMFEDMPYIPTGTSRTRPSMGFVPTIILMTARILQS